MLRGIDVGGLMGTLKETVLLKAIQREEEIEHLKTLINFQSAALITSKGNSEITKTLNDYFKEYEELRNPTILKNRKEAVKNKSKDIKNIDNLDLKELFKNNKVVKSSTFNNATKQNNTGVIKII